MINDGWRCFWWSGYRTYGMAEVTGRATMIRFVAARSIDWWRWWWWSGYRTYRTAEKFTGRSTMMRVCSKLLLLLIITLTITITITITKTLIDSFHDTTSKCTKDIHNIMIDSSSSSTVLVVVVVVAALLWSVFDSIVLLLILYPVPCMVWYGMLRYGTGRMVVVTGCVCSLSGGLRPDSIIIIIASHTQQCRVLDACMCWHGRGI